MLNLRAFDIKAFISIACTSAIFASSSKTSSSWTCMNISSRSALTLFIVLLLLALILVLQTNLLTIQLSLIAVSLAAIYPFTKRWTSLPQLVLGVAFGMSVPMAFAAQTGTIAIEAGLIFIGSLVWTLIYDTLFQLKFVWVVFELNPQRGRKKLFNQNFIGCY